MNVQSSQRNKFALMTEINMVPLIDVALVLLIIFMVVTPFLVTQQIKINLPKAAASAQADAEPIKILINARKTYYLDGKAVLEKDLMPLLKQKLGGNLARPVLIEADASVPFQYIVSAMDQAKAAQAQKLGVATTAPEKITAP